MFSMTCRECGTTRLMPLSDIVALRRSDRGFVAEVRCPCGTTETHDFARAARPTQRLDIPRSTRLA